MKKQFNPIREYYQLIKDGKVVVSKKVKIQYEYLIWLIDHSKKWKYDEKQAIKAIAFIENFCKHSTGDMGGKPFLLELWQKAFVVAIFGIVDIETGKRKHRKATLIIGRKNGKSTLASAIAIYMFIMDNEPGAQIFTVGVNREQAKIVWKESKSMISKDPTLRRLAKSRVADIVYGDCLYKPLSRDSNSLDGLNVHCGVLDEMHAWTDQNLYDVVVDATSARSNWLILTITTAGTVRGSVFDRLYDDGVEHLTNIAKHNQKNFEDYTENMLFVAYELDSRDEWTDPKCWQKANPGLGTIKKFKDLENEVEAAKRNSDKVKNLLTKQFNIRETSSDAWLSIEDIINEETFDINELKPKYALGGFDLSETTDLTCASLMFMIPNSDKIYLKQMYWMPSDTLEIREKEDKVPYQKWVEQGYLTICDGNRVNHKVIKEWFLEMQDKYGVYLFAIGYDRWSANYLVDDMEQTFGKKTMEAVAQGAQTLSAPMYQLGAEMRSKKIVYNRNPIFEWCCTNVRVSPDRNGNIVPIKIKQSKVRIDGFASALDAYVALDRNREDYLGMIGA